MSWVSTVPWITLAAAAVLAVLTPIVIVMVRHEVRLRRIRLIDAFSRSFGAAPRESTCPEAQDAEPKVVEGDNVQKLPVPANDGHNQSIPQRPVPAKSVDRTPSFEFVLAKYSVDLDRVPPDVDRDKLRSLDLTDSKVDEYLGKLKWYQLRSNWRIVWASLPYVLCCFFGFTITFYPLAPAQFPPVEWFIGPTFLTSGGIAASADSADAARHFQHVSTIAALSFVGAYLFTLRTFVRAVTVFDLNSITVLRATAHILLSVAGAVLIYRALPDIAAVFPGSPQPSSAVPTSISSIWYILAFVFGFVPDFALQFLFARASQVSSAVKTMDDRFGAQTRSVPLDIIEGIDFPTRYRLEEANVFEVQNLACANPIMLHVETPYGIYQTIDWVAQAQLCAVVGPERFLIMRQNHIRTIFDLERAVLSPLSTPELRRFVGMLLLMPTQTCTQLVDDVLKAKFPGFDKVPVASLDLQEFHAATATLFAARHAQQEGGPTDATLAHLVRIIVDDLHVHRLRQIWMTIAHRLGAPAASLNNMEKGEFWAQAA